MKMTIVTDSAGNVIAAVQGHSLTEQTNGLQAGVTFGPGHQLHQVEVDDNMAVISDVGEYVKQLQAHITP
jgi:hypothetical protein